MQKKRKERNKMLETWTEVIIALLITFVSWCVKIAIVALIVFGIYKLCF